MLKDKNIVFGVSGGIAAYKAVDVVSRLKKQCANIDVIMTNSSTKFVTPLTFQSLSQNYVTVDMFEEPKTWEVEHISLAQKADLFLVAPATANLIGKIANGIADDMLTTTIMATKAKVVFAPAMNTNMYTNPIFIENMDKLKALGYEFIKPGAGRLACGDYGEGKMAEPVDIVDYVVNLLANDELREKKIVVTAGPTVEDIDPVRYITNNSSGKMGYYLANEAKKRGAEVVLISGPTKLNPPNGVKVINVKTTDEMFRETIKHFKDCHVTIKAAAPLDYKPKIYSYEKIKKNNEELNINLIKNKDIAYEIGKLKKHQITVGFAAESNDLVKNAKEKLIRKNFDFIVANNIVLEGAGFRGDTNIVTIIDNNGKEEKYSKMTKEELSKVIIDKVIKLL